MVREEGKHCSYKVCICRLIVQAFLCRYVVVIRGLKRMYLVSGRMDRLHLVCWVISTLGLVDLYKQVT